MRCFLLIAIALAAFVEAGRNPALGVGIGGSVVSTAVYMKKNNQRARLPPVTTEGYGDNALVMAVENGQFLNFYQSANPSLRALCPTGSERIFTYQDAIAAALAQSEAREIIQALFETCNADDLTAAVNSLPEELQMQFSEIMRIGGDEVIQSQVPTANPEDFEELPEPYQGEFELQEQDDEIQMTSNVEELPEDDAFDQEPATEVETTIPEAETQVDNEQAESAAATAQSETVHYRTRGAYMK